MNDTELEDILLDAGVVRNRLKIYSVRKNAIVALELQEEFGSLDAYFWNSQWLRHSDEGRIQVSEKWNTGSFVPQDDGNKFPVIHHGATIYDFPTEDDISRVISKDLKKRGMSFVGSTIIYAFMQAVGMVDDHIDTCWRKNNL